MRSFADFGMYATGVAHVPLLREPDAGEVGAQDVDHAIRDTFHLFGQRTGAEQVFLEFFHVTFALCLRFTKSVYLFP